MATPTLESTISVCGKFEHDSEFGNHCYNKQHWTGRGRSLSLSILISRTGTSHSISPIGSCSLYNGFVSITNDSRLTVYCYVHVNACYSDSVRTS